MNEPTSINESASQTQCSKPLDPVFESDNKGTFMTAT